MIYWQDMKSNKTTYMLAGIIIVAFGLIIWGGKNATPIATFWADTSFECLQNTQLGGGGVSRHDHISLSITSDGLEEVFPTNVGSSTLCMSELHTHGPDGSLHVELIKNRVITVEDFFTVWGKSMQRDGFDVKVIIGGEERADYNTYDLRDGDEVVISYTSVDSTQDDVMDEDAEIGTMDISGQ